jgi:CubicO group peptidase (beta-lactamase class C family)
MKSTLRALILLAIAGAFAVAGPPSARTLAAFTLTSNLTEQAAQPSLDDALRDVDTTLDKAVTADGVGGVSAAVMAGGKVVWSRHYGYAEVETKRVATSTTDYRIGSITKQFTALMLLQLVEQGKVRLTDPVRTYLPEFDQVKDAIPGAAPVTLLQLATMTSGLAREPDGLMSETSLGPLSEWQHKVLSLLPVTHFAHPPGTEYLYSNIGYASLGLALERAAGQPYTTYVTDHIITPLGLTRTGFEPTAGVMSNLAHGYTKPRGGGTPDRKAPDQELDGRGFRVPNGALFSTIDDLAKFAAWELGDGPASLLNPATQSANYARVYTTADAPAGGLTLSSFYGLGFMARRVGNDVFIGHTGSTTGFLSAVFVHRPTKTAIIVLHNGDGGTFQPDREAIRALSKIVAATKH